MNKKKHTHTKKHIIQSLFLFYQCCSWVYMLLILDCRPACLTRCKLCQKPNFWPNLASTPSFWKLLYQAVNPTLCIHLPWFPVFFFLCYYAAILPSFSYLCLMKSYGILSNSALSRGPLRPLIYIGVHMHDQKMFEKWSFYFLAVEHINKEEHIRGLKCHIFGKRRWFCQNLLKFFRLKTY